MTQSASTVVGSHTLMFAGVTSAFVFFKLCIINDLGVLGAAGMGDSSISTTWAVCCGVVGVAPVGPSGIGVASGSGRIPDISLSLSHDCGEGAGGSKSLGKH